MRLAPLFSGALLLGLTAACSDVGFGLKNHPGDCALGIAWADCLPGTPGYRGTPAQLAYQGVYKQQADEAAQRQHRLDAANDEAQRCGERRKAGELPDHMAAARCMNDALERGFRETRYPNMDLIYSVSATRLRAAEQIDKGEITEAEAAVRITEKISAVASEEGRRNAERTNANAALTSAKAQVDAANAQADTAREMGLMNTLRLDAAARPAAPPPPALPRTTTCRTNYGTMTCTTQ